MEHTVLIIEPDLEQGKEIFRTLVQAGYDAIIVSGTDEALRPFRDCEFAFVHPKAVNGVLLELIDYKWDELKE